MQRPEDEQHMCPVCKLQWSSETSMEVHKTCCESEDEMAKSDKALCHRVLETLRDPAFVRSAENMKDTNAKAKVETIRKSRNYCNEKDEITTREVLQLITVVKSRRCFL